MKLYDVQMTNADAPQDDERLELTAIEVVNRWPWVEPVINTDRLGVGYEFHDVAWTIGLFHCSITAIA